MIIKIKVVLEITIIIMDMGRIYTLGEFVHTEKVMQIRMLLQHRLFLSVINRQNCI